MYFSIYKTMTGYPQKYWWVAKGNNNETMCQSEMLSSKQTCVSAIGVIQSGASTAKIYDSTGE
jgi:uncharacterized protein YegP (UPF0339 family)